MSTFDRFNYDEATDGERKSYSQGSKDAFHEVSDFLLEYVDEAKSWLPKDRITPEQELALQSLLHEFELRFLYQPREF